MANFNISYKFVALDKFSRVSKKIGKSVDKLGGKINTFSSKGMKALFSLKGAFTGLLTGIGIAEVGSIFRNLGAGFQDQVADMQALTGAFGNDLDLLKSKAFELGKASAVSGSDVVEGFKLVGGAKAELLKNIPALIGTTKEVLLLKNAAGIELSEAAIFTAQSLNIFGAGADQASRFVNVLAAGAKEGASEVRDTGEAMMIAGPLASKLGLSFEQVTAMLQALAKGVGKGRIAGTGLQGVLSRLSTFGVDFAKTSPQDIFIKIGKAIDAETNTAKKAILIQKLFGVEHQKTGLTLIAEARTLNGLTRALTGTNTAQEQATIRLATFNAKMRSLGTIIEEKIVLTFERLAPTLEKLTIKFGNWLETITPEDIEKIANSLVKVAEAIGMIVSGMDKLGAVKEFSEKYFVPAMMAKKARGLMGAGIEKMLGESTSKVEVHIKGDTSKVEKVKSRGGVSTKLDMGQNMVPAT